MPSCSPQYLQRRSVCLFARPQSVTEFPAGRTSLSLLFLAFLFHLSISSIILLLPIALLILGRPTSQLASPRPSTSNLRLLIPLFLEYWFYVAILSFISTLVAGSWTWIPQTWGATYVILPFQPRWRLMFSRLTLPDLTPNTGLWWYFFTEMFDHYRPFFLVVFNVRAGFSLYKPG